MGGNTCCLCCPKVRDDYGTFFCCMPLILSFTFICLFVLWAGTLCIYFGAVSTDFPSLGTITLLIIGSIELLFAIVGLVGACVRIEGLLRFFKLGFQIFIGLAILSFLLTLIGWIVALCATPKWEPLVTEVITLVMVCLANIIFFICCWWILGLVESLVKVVEVGGTGWEKMNYTELEEQFGDEDEEEGVSHHSSHKQAKHNRSKSRNLDSDQSEMSDVVSV